MAKKLDTPTAGNLMFPKVSATGGEMIGVSVVTTANSPQQVALIDFAQVLLADDGRVDLQASDQASVQMDSAPAAGASNLVSTWQLNLWTLKAIREVTCLLINSGWTQPGTSVAAVAIAVREMREISSPRMRALRVSR